MKNYIFIFLLSLLSFNLTSQVDFGTDNFCEVEQFSNDTITYDGYYYENYSQEFGHEATEVVILITKDSAEVKFDNISLDFDYDSEEGDIRYYTCCNDLINERLVVYYRNNKPYMVEIEMAIAASADMRFFRILRDNYVE